MNKMEYITKSASGSTDSIIRDLDGSAADGNSLLSKRMATETIGRLATPKPVIYLGSSTEFMRQASGIPRTPFNTTSAHIRSSAAQRRIPKPTNRPESSATSRPMTAVRGAGYTSQARTLDGSSSTTIIGNVNPHSPDLQAEDNPLEKMRVQSDKINRLAEESCLLGAKGQYRDALHKAKEASNKERSLIKLEEQSELTELHNVNLNFFVLFNLAHLYALNELYTEALNTYQLILKNSMFSHSYRLKVNMGNIYLQQGQHQQALKLYRMALDQAPSGHKHFRTKIMHNIALVFVRLGQWSEAVSSLEYIMSEQACHRAGIHLVAACAALEDSERMRNSFMQLLAVPLAEGADDDDKYQMEQDTAEDLMIAIAIRDDALHRLEKRRRRDAEFCILAAAKLIAPHVHSSFAAGYEWCASAIKNSEYARLAADLEINKAIMYLRQKRVPEAIKTLKAFERDSAIESGAAANLAFIYYLQGDLANAQRYAEMSQPDTVEGCNNMGVCLMQKNDLNAARDCFQRALDINPFHFEAIYNLGLVLKMQGHYTESLQCFQRFPGSLALLPIVLYQVGHLLELNDDREAAADTYQQLLGLVPNDAAVIERLANLFDRDGDKQQAHHHQTEAYRHYPAQLSVLHWLGSYYIEMQVVEKALTFFDKAATIQPNEPKWALMVAACHRRSGNMHRALTLYQDIHKRFPENIDCLKLLARLCTDLGMRESTDYIQELKRLEKTKEVRERVNSSRPQSRRMTSIGRMMSASSSSHPETVIQATISSSYTTHQRLSARSISTDSSESGFTATAFATSNNGLDVTYEEPIIMQSLMNRPRTTAKPTDYQDFGNDPLGDDLLPE